MKTKVIYYLKFRILRKKPKKTRETTAKEGTLKSLYLLKYGTKMVLNGFKSKIFPLQTTEGTGVSDRIAMVFDHSHPKILSFE